MRLSRQMLSLAIRENTAYHPFERDFDVEQFSSFCNSYSDLENEAADLKEVILKTHNEWKFLYDAMRLAFAQLQLTDEDFLNAVLAATNRYFFQVNGLMDTVNAANQFQSPEYGHFMKVENKAGEQVNISTTQERSADIAVWLIKFHFEIKSKNATPAENTVQQRAILTLLQNIINDVISLQEDILPQLIYEESVAIKNGPFGVSIKRINPEIDKLRHIGHIRQSSHTIESTIHLNRTLKSKEKSKVLRINKIENGQIHFVGSESVKEGIGLSHLAVLFKYHAHVADMPLTRYGSITVKDCVDLLDLIFDCFQQYAVTQNNIDNIPIFSTTESITSIVNQITGHSKTIIELFFEDLTVDLHKPYLWRRPLIRHHDKYYYCLQPLVAPNINLYIERWLELEQVSLEQRLKRYSGFLTELFNKERGDYSIKMSTFKLQGIELFPTILLLKLKTVILVVKLIDYNYPIEDREHFYILQMLKKKAIELEERIPLLKAENQNDFGDKKVLLCLLSEYPTYSGLQINNVSVVDYSLLSNYLFVGKLQKAVYRQDTFNTSKVVAENKYYSDEDSFCENLEIFLKQPPTVFSLYDHLVTKTAKVYHSEKLMIELEFTSHIGEEQVTSLQTEQIEQLLNYEYYAEPEENVGGAIAQRVQYELTDIFLRWARASYIPYVQRTELWAATLKSKMVGQAYLVHFIIKSFNRFHFEKPKKAKSTTPFKKIDDLTSLISRLAPYINGTSLSTFDMPNIFSEREAWNLITAAVAAFEIKGYVQLNDDDLFGLSTNLLILRGFSKKYLIKDIFYMAASNFVDMLNYSGHYQKARDVCEEILLLSTKKYDHHHAWLILFNCYTAQNNARESAIYGGLLFSSVQGLGASSYELGINISLAFMKFCRNFKFYDYSILVYNQLKAEWLKPYDRLRLAAIFFNTQLKNLNANPAALDELPFFINENIDLMARFGDNGSVPILAILMNLKRLASVNVTVPSFDIDGSIAKLRPIISAKALAEIEIKIIGDSKTIKEEFVNSLLRLSETRSVFDYVNESELLNVPASNLIRIGLRENQPEYVLLASLVRTDQSLNFVNKTAEPRAPLIKPIDGELAKRLKNYLPYFLDNLSLREGQVFMWIFDYDGLVGYLVINEHKQTSLRALGKWLYPVIDEFTRNINTFHFNVKNKSSIDYDESVQKKEFDKMLSEYDSFDLQIPFSFNEILLSASIELSAWPPNLLINNKSFLAFEHPVTNIISPQYCIENSAVKTVSENCPVMAWIPTEDGNMTINWGHQNLESVLEKMNAQIITAAQPNKPMHGDINVFMAHGARDFFGFKTVRTGEDKETSIIYPSTIFGQGIIAILFICNSGSSAEDIYSNQVTSFSYELLQMGYQTVISSFWPYDVTMSKRWLEGFFTSFNTGHSVSKSVFLANKSLTVFDEESGTIFLAPQGCLSMHVYGNPNIYRKAPPVTDKH